MAAARDGRVPVNWSCHVEAISAEPEPFIAPDRDEHFPVKIKQ
jgi:hypothetical protein